MTLPKRLLQSFKSHPLAWLIVLLLLRQAISLIFHGATYYADEYKDYFTTLHGLVHGHELGEWYEKTGMRSFVILFPLLPFVYLYKWLNFTDLYILEQLVKTVVGLYSTLCLVFLYKLAEKIIDQERAILLGFIYIFHSIAIYANHTILTEQGAAITFLMAFWMVHHLMTTEDPPKGWVLFGWYSLFWLTAGFSVLARLDSLFFMAPLGLHYMWKDRDKISWGLWFLSLFLIFMTYGFMESLFSGEFYGPQVNRFLFEAVERKGYIGAIDHRSRILFDLGGNLFYPFFVVALYYFFKTIKKPSIFHFPILFFVLFHTWMPHKEFRYVYPIVFIVLLFLFSHLPKDFIQDFKQKKVLLFWFFVGLNWFAVLFFYIPWGGQPRLSQQISYLNYHYEKVPIHIAMPPDPIPKESPLLDFLKHQTLNDTEVVIPKPYILFVHDGFQEKWKGFVGENSCLEIYNLGQRAKPNIKKSFYLHYLCE